MGPMRSDLSRARKVPAAIAIVAVVVVASAPSAFARTKKVSPKAYVHATCVALAALKQGVNAQDAALAKQPASTASDAKIGLSTYLHGYATVLHDSIAALKQAGVPKVKGGAAIAAFLPKRLAKIRASLVKLDAQVSTVSADNAGLATMQQIATAGDAQIKGIGTAVNTLINDKFPGPGSLSPALAHDGSCTFLVL
jgi:hypothetical protein